MFYEATMFNHCIGQWDVSSVMNMRSMFDGAESFNQDISNWKVHNVQDMSKMFRFSTSFDQDIGEWDVTRVLDMSDMFRGAVTFNRNLGGWNVSTETNVSMMFFNASTLLRNLGRVNDEDGVWSSFFHEFLVSKTPESRKAYFSQLFPWERRSSFLMFLAMSGYLSSACACTRNKDEEKKDNSSIDDKHTPAPSPCDKIFDIEDIYRYICTFL
jgi:surface protein